MFLGGLSVQNRKLSLAEKNGTTSYVHFHEKKIEVIFFIISWEIYMMKSRLECILNTASAAAYVFCNVFKAKVHSFALYFGIEQYLIWLQKVYKCLRHSCGTINHTSFRESLERRLCTLQYYIDCILWILCCKQKWSPLETRPQILCGCYGSG